MLFVFILNPRNSPTITVPKRKPGIVNKKNIWEIKIPQIILEKKASEFIKSQGNSICILAMMKNSIAIPGVTINLNNLVK
jgi:hypothetical protein